MNVLLVILVSLSGWMSNRQIERQEIRNYRQESRMESKYFVRLDRHERRIEKSLDTEVMVFDGSDYYASINDAACSVEPGVQGTFWFCVCPTGNDNKCTASDYLAAKAKKDKELGRGWCTSNSCNGHCRADTECSGEGSSGRRKDVSGACSQSNEESVFVCCWRMTGCERTGDCECEGFGTGD